MGAWAQRRKRGGGGIPNALAAPVLTDAGGELLTWTWSGADPFQWIIEQSADGVSAWAAFDNPGGAARSEPGVDSGFFYRITGDSGSGPVTGTSNVVGPVA